MTQELLKLAVMVLAEGSVLTRPKRMQISFSNTSPELQKAFRECVIKLGFRPKVKDRKTFLVESNVLTRKLLELSPTFRTKNCNHKPICPWLKGKEWGCKPLNIDGKLIPPATFPQDVLNASKEDLAEFCRLFVSCEGGPVFANSPKNNEVSIRVCNPILRNQFIQMLKKLGLKPGLRGNSLIFIKRKKELLKFRERIGFVNGVKTVRGKNKEKDKNELLELIIKTPRSV